MIRNSWQWKGYSGVMLRTPPKEPFPPNDSVLFQPFADRLRIALIDGITDTPYTKSHANLSGGTWASSVIEATLKSTNDIRTCLLWANVVLWDRHQTYRRSQQQASLVAIDIFIDGRVEAIRAGDTFFAVKKKSWRKIFSGDPRDPKIIKKYIEEGIWNTPGQFYNTQEFLSLGGWTPDDYGRGEKEPFVDQEVWLSTPIGAFPEVKLERTFLQKNDWKEICLGTDGAEPEKSSDLDKIESVKIGEDESFCAVYR